MEMGEQSAQSSPRSEQGGHQECCQQHLGMWCDSDSVTVTAVGQALGTLQPPHSTPSAPQCRGLTQLGQFSVKQGSSDQPKVL